jgi:hypothetical protein
LPPPPPSQPHIQCPANSYPNNSIALHNRPLLISNPATEMKTGQYRKFGTRPLCGYRPLLALAIGTRFAASATRSLPCLRQENEREPSLLDAALASGFAVAAAGPVSRASRMRGSNRCSSPIGRRRQIHPETGRARNRKPPAGWVYRLEAFVLQGLTSGRHDVRHGYCA